MRIIFSGKITGGLMVAKINDAFYMPDEKTLCLMSFGGTFIVPDISKTKANKLLRDLFAEGKLDLSNQNVVGPLLRDLDDDFDDEEDFEDENFEDDGPFDAATFREMMADLLNTPPTTIPKNDSKKNAPPIPFAIKSKNNPFD